MGELSHKAARIKQRYSSDPKNFAYAQTKVWEELSPMEKASSMFQEYTKKGTELAKEVGTGMKTAVTESLVTGMDVMERASPNEFGRNVNAGIKEVVTGDKNVPASIRFQKGALERFSRPLRMEKLTGQQLNNPDGTVNWDFARKFVGRAMEIPTYAYAGAVQGGSLVGKGLLSRILTRSASTVPEAGINTAIQTFEEGSTENVTTNFLANALLMSGVSNIAGEIKFPTEVLNKTIGDIEGQVGKLTPEQRLDVQDALKQGVKSEEILTNLQKVVKNEVTPDEVAAKVNAAIEPPKVETPVVEPAPKIVQAPSKTAENITGWTSGARKSFDDDTIATLRKERIGVNEIPYDKDGNITLYRDGKVEDGTPQSYSLSKIDDKQKPYTVNKNDILVNFNGKEASEFMNKNFQRGDRDIALESFEHWKNFEKEVVVLKEKNSQVESTPVIKETETPKEVKVPQSQMPVGTGKEKVSRLEARMTGNLGKLTEEQKEAIGLSTYNQMNKADQIKSAAEYVTANPDNVIKILSGEMEPPKGLLKNSIYVAAENMAHDDAGLARRLASLSSTRIGQELSILTEALEDSPVKAMREVSDARIQATEKRLKSGSVSKTRSEITKKAKESVDKTVAKAIKEDWNSFVESIKCNS